MITKVIGGSVRSKTLEIKTLTVTPVIERDR